MSCRNRLSCVSSLLFLVSILAISCPAQVDRGGIVGVVTDPGGAVVAGAQVTVTNADFYWCFDSPILIDAPLYVCHMPLR